MFWKQELYKTYGETMSSEVQVDNVPCFSLVYQDSLFIIEINQEIQYYSATRTSVRLLIFSTRNKKYSYTYQGSSA